MTSSEQIKMWLKKMNYPGNIPSNEDLHDLCRGAVGPIFQQIIDKVKPKSEIDHIRKNIVINNLCNKNKISGVQEANKQLELYERKQQLEKQLEEMKERNQTKEENLRHFVSKTKMKNAKIHALNLKIRENKKDATIFQAKEAELDEILKTSKKLKEDSYILENSTNNTMNIKEQTQEKINDAMKILTEVLEKNDLSSQTFIQEKRISEFEMTASKALSTRSGVKRPHSQRKNKMTSSRRNIFDSLNNLFIPTSSSRKKNIEKSSFDLLNNSTLSSIGGNSLGKVLDKSSDTYTVLDTACSNSPELQRSVENLWRQSNRNIVWELLKDLKYKDNIRIMNMVAETISYDDEKFDDGLLEVLYNCHIQNEFSRKQTEMRQSQLEMEACQKNKFDGSTEDLVKLQSVEAGLQSAIARFHQNIDQLRNNTVPDPCLDAILADTDNLRADMMNMKHKIENQLCLLYDCNSWIEKSHRSVQDVASRPFPVIDCDLLDEQFTESHSQAFCDFPIHFNNRHYFDSWNQVYCSPEMLEIIGNPHLSIENILIQNFSEKKLMQKLSTCKNESDISFSTDHVNSLLKFECNHVNAKESIETLQKSSDICHKTLSSFDGIEKAIALRLEQPVNEFISDKRKFNGKSFKEYAIEYESYYKQV